MMTLDEAIKHAEDMAELNEAECFECAEEHRQLAEWLKELKELRKEARTIADDAYEKGKGDRPHGEWIVEPLSDIRAWYVCSVCGDKVCCKGNNFCPNCGADMRKEGDEK